MSIINLPSESDVQTNIYNAIILFEELDGFATRSATNYLDVEEAILNSSVQDYAPEVAGAMAQLRARYVNLLTPATIRSILDPMFITYGRVIGVSATNADTVLFEIYRRMVANGYEIKSRGMSLGSVSSITGTGTGLVQRLTVDEYGYSPENVTPETKKFECTADARSGAARHEEIFTLTGSPVGRDLLDISKGGGSGVNLTLAAQSARTSLARNASFSSYSGTTAVPTAITNWDAGTIGNLAIDTTNYYRDYVGDTTPASLKFSDNTYVEQNLDDTNVTLNPNRPYYLQIAYNRSIGSGDGTLTIQLGNTTKSVTLSAQTGWNILRLDLDSGLWFKNFNKQDPTIKITLSGRTSGYTLVDDVIFCQMSYIDGLYYTIVGGATPFLKDAYFTVVDTDGGTVGDGLINKWLWRAYSRYLPHTTAASASWWVGDDT